MPGLVPGPGLSLTLTISFAGSINPTKQIFTLSAKRLGPVLGLNDSQEINLILKIQIPTKHLLHKQGISSNIFNLCIEKCTLAFYVYLAHYSKEAVRSHNPELTSGQHFMGIVVKVAQLITINAWGEKLGTFCLLVVFITSIMGVTPGPSETSVVAKV